MKNFSEFIDGIIAFGRKHKNCPLCTEHYHCQACDAEIAGGIEVAPYEYVCDEECLDKYSLSMK